jgi:hypothetical protein
VEDRISRVCRYFAEARRRWSARRAEPNVRRLFGRLVSAAPRRACLRPLLEPCPGASSAWRRNAGPKRGSGGRARSFWRRRDIRLSAADDRILAKAGPGSEPSRTSAGRWKHAPASSRKAGLRAKSCSVFPAELEEVLAVEGMRGGHRAKQASEPAAPAHGRRLIGGPHAGAEAMRSWRPVVVVKGVRTDFGDEHCASVRAIVSDGFGRVCWTFSDP